MIKGTLNKQGHLRISLKYNLKYFSILRFSVYKICQALQIGSLYIDSEEIIKLCFGHSIYADFVLKFAIIKQG